MENQTLEELNTERTDLLKEHFFNSLVLGLDVLGSRDMIKLCVTSVHQHHNRCLLLMEWLTKIVESLVCLLA